ncbi:MAG: hypothetical protein ACREEM_19270 [Blastocatellia bacterium]
MHLADERVIGAAPANREHTVELFARQEPDQPRAWLPQPVRESSRVLRRGSQEQRLFAIQLLTQRGELRRIGRILDLILQGDDLFEQFGAINWLRRHRRADKQSQKER